MQSDPRTPRKRKPPTPQQRLYQFADDYDRCVIRAWITRDVAGMEDEHRDARRQLEVARRRMDRAGRGLSS